MQYERLAESPTDWIKGITVDIAREDVGGRTFGEYEAVLANNGRVSNCFDGNIYNYFDSYSSAEVDTYPETHYVVYAAEEVSHAFAH